MTLNPQDQLSLELGAQIRALVHDQSTWSQSTFGPDSERGPIRALRHLEKESREAQDAIHDISEYADCLLLILDASRRAGFSVIDLVIASCDKMKINKSRTWPKPIDDTPVEHVRNAE